MKVIGVTGGTGSGKSTVSRILEEKGAIILDADKTAKELQKRGTEAFSEIVKCFGSEVVDKESGELDRHALAKIVFSDKDKLLLLNNIVHKRVAESFKNELARLEKEDAKLVVLDVPLPTEEGFFELVNCVWAVVANADLRVERIVARSGITEEEAEKRIAAQKSNSEYEEIADVVIQNEGTEEELRQLVEYELMRATQAF